MDASPVTVFTALVIVDRYLREMGSVAYFVMVTGWVRVGLVRLVWLWPACCRVEVRDSW
jgi:hypothetical protein